MSKVKVELNKEETSTETYFYFEFIGMITILIALILLAKLGIIGQFLSILFLFVFGDWYWLILFSAIFYGGNMIFRHKLIVLKTKKVLGYILAILAILALSHIPYAKVYDDNIIGNTWSYYLYIIDSNKDDINQTVYGGGVIGAILVSLLKFFFGIIGTQIILYVLLGLGITTVIDKDLNEYKDKIAELKHFALRIRSKLSNQITDKKRVKILKNNNFKQSRTNKYKDKIARIGESDLEIAEEIILGKKHEKKSPYIGLLDNYSDDGYNIMQLEVSKKIANNIQSILNDFPIKGKIESLQVTSIFSWLNISFEKDLSEYRKEMLHNEIEDKLRDYKFRIVKDKENYKIRIEINNIYINKIKLGQLIDKNNKYEFKKEFKNIAFALNEFYEVFSWEFQSIPHLIVAASSHTAILNLLKVILISTFFTYSHKYTKFLIIDFKNKELHDIGEMSHFVTNTITNINISLNVLQKLTKEMDRRYTVINNNGFDNIESFNHSRIRRKLDPMARLIVMITEINDLMFANKEQVENIIFQVTQLGAKVGIHLFIATSICTQKAISSIIKANIKSRLVFNLDKKSTSNWLVDNDDATKLCTTYDCILSDNAYVDNIRLQVPYVSSEEYSNVISYMLEK